MNDLETLARQAVEHLLAQQPMMVTHPPGWQRNGYPLPMKRAKPAADGSVTQPYRPLAILEYVHEKLSKPAKTEEEENLFATEDEDLFS